MTFPEYRHASRGTVRAALAAAVFASCILQAAPGAQAAPHAGAADAVEGTVIALDAAGRLRRLEDGDPVYEGERITTRKDSRATLVFTDETRSVLGESTIITIDTYRYDEDSDTAADQDEEPAMGMSLLKGVLRSITGVLAKLSASRVRYSTPVATIGVRGTHFVAEVEGTSATVILLTEEREETENAIEVSNEFGSVRIDKPGFGTNIPDAMSPPSPPRRMRTQTMNRILRGVNIMRRVRVPRPPPRF